MAFSNEGGEVFWRNCVACCYYHCIRAQKGGPDPLVMQLVLMDVLDWVDCRAEERLQALAFLYEEIIRRQLPAG